MRSILILAIFALFFASCHNNVPELPSPEEVKEYKFCGYIDKEGDKCKSTYEIKPGDCEVVGGTFFCDTACTEPYVEGEPCN